MVIFMTKKICRKKKRGSGLLPFVLGLGLIAIISITVLSSTQTGRNTLMLHKTKSQANEAAKYAIKKYIENDKRIFSNEDPINERIMGEDEKYVVEYEYEEVDSEIIGGGPVGGENKSQGFIFYPQIDETYTKVLELDKQGEYISVSGNNDLNLNYTSYIISSLDTSNKQILNKEYLLGKEILSEKDFKLNAENIELFKSVGTFNTNLSCYQTLYFLISSKEDISTLKIYASYNNISNELIKLEEHNLDFKVTAMDAAGVYSPGLNSNICYLTLKTADNSIKVFEYIEEKNHLEEYYTEDNVKIQSFATSSVFNKALGVSQYYLSYFDEDNKYHIYKFLNKNSKEELPYTSSITAGSEGATFSIGTIYNENLNCTLLYLVKKSKNELNSIDTYRFITNFALNWEQVDKQTLDYVGNLKLACIYSEVPTMFLLNEDMNTKFVKKASLKVTGYVYDKSRGQKNMVAKSVYTCNTEIEYQRKGTSVEVNYIKIKNIN
jgi:hypothetical protein